MSDKVGRVEFGPDGKSQPVQQPDVVFRRATPDVHLDETYDDPAGQDRECTRTDQPCAAPYPLDDCQYDRMQQQLAELEAENARLDLELNARLGIYCEKHGAEDMPTGCPDCHAEQRIKELEAENVELEAENERLNDECGLLQVEVEVSEKQRKQAEQKLTEARAVLERYRLSASRGDWFNQLIAILGRGVDRHRVSHARGGVNEHQQEQ